MRDLPRVKKLIAHEMSDFLMWYYSLPLMPVFQKTRVKPDKTTVAEILKIKQFLIKNVSELHKLAMRNDGSAKDDLQNHVELVQKLQSMKNASFEVLMRKDIDYRSRGSSCALETNFNGQSSKNFFRLKPKSNIKPPRPTAYVALQKSSTKVLFTRQIETAL